MRVRTNSRVNNPLALIPFIIFFVIIVVLYFTFSNTGENKEGYIETTATVVEIDYHFDKIYVEYEVDGVTYNNKLDYSSDYIDYDDEITIYYSPDDPNTLYSEGSDTIPVIFFIIFGGIIILMLVVSIIQKKKGINNTANSFSNGFDSFTNDGFQDVSQNSYNPGDPLNDIPSNSESTVNGTMFSFTSSNNEFYLKDKNGEVAYEVLPISFKVIGNSEYSFYNHYSGFKKNHTISNITDKFDDSTMNDYLDKNNIRVSNNRNEIIVSMNNDQIAKIKVNSKGNYSVEAKEDYLDQVIITILSIDKTM